jgi:hypothetical protein
MLKKLFPPSKTGSGAPQNIIVVSGLPRSGTSMMMKMLAEGGLEIVSDTVRTADDDNPNGYFEFEQVKQLDDGKVEWLAGARGKVVKIISSLLEYLPGEYHYKIIFMERDLKEVLASQQKMLKNRQEQSQVEDTQMREQFDKHLVSVKYWLARQPNMEVLYVNYNRLITIPQEYCVRIAEYVGIPLDVEKMLAVPNVTLYRNRVKSG